MRAECNGIRRCLIAGVIWQSRTGSSVGSLSTQFRCLLVMQIIKSFQMIHKAAFREHSVRTFKREFLTESFSQRGSYLEGSIREPPRELVEKHNLMSAVRTE